MFALGPIAFATPWLLMGLALLPVLWLILRAVPPAPVRRRFPGVALLLGLDDPEAETDKTPWWLLLLRMLAVAALIVGFAGPVLNPADRVAGQGPLLILSDGSWASARDWAARRDRIAALLDEAAADARPVAVATLTDLPPGAPAFQPANLVAQTLQGLDPAPFAPTDAMIADWIDALGATRFDTIWVSDGLDHGWRADLVDDLRGRGILRVIEGRSPVLALQPAVIDAGQVSVTVLRSPAGPARDVTVLAHGPDPAGIPRVLDRITVTFDAGATQATGAFDLPPELRNRVSRFEIAGQASAGTVALADDSLRRREIALFAGRDDREGLELLAPLHYLRRALAPSADVLDLPLLDALPANPDVVILADVAQLAPAEAEALTEWVSAGGILLRFAGPRLAGSEIGRGADDPLLPVRLRSGGRSVGGAMSWGGPQSLRPFDDGSPFFGLDIPADVAVTAQVLAQPSPDLAQRTIAALGDGTPLVTRKTLGAGQVVLFHVTANAEWSSLPLSGLFMAMLDRLAVLSAAPLPGDADLAGTTWTADQVLGAFGTLEDASRLPGVAGADLLTAPLGPRLPPGLYAGEDRRIARNVIAPGADLRPAAWPADQPVEGLAATPPRDLAGLLLALALVLLIVDTVASMALSGKLRGRAAIAVLALALILPGTPSPAQQDGLSDADLIRATSRVVLAHVLTGNPDLDRLAEAGLFGLSQVLFNRTSIEPDAPMGVDLETAELSVFPFLYWPVDTTQPLPSDTAYAKLNAYLRGGGMILFDTRDANLAVAGMETPGELALQRLAAPLDIPPLEPVPDDHVLTRTFYLLQDFPGRYASRLVWVEAAPPDAELVAGMPFRNLNDGVTPVVIGGNDWAAAWAIGENGAPLLPVGRGNAGQQQREIAYRFGVNLIMHVLTGNYKSDQVHVPALLDRLGQ